VDLSVLHAQILSYLKLSGKSIGLLINFNVVHLKNGIKRLRTAQTENKSINHEGQEVTRSLSS
jgi:hypothetical protein